jgi:hypothetical protein
VEGETTYTVGEAAALLQETPERVREMLASGDLDGIPPGATVSGEWKVLLPTRLGGEESGQETPAERDAGRPRLEQEEATATAEGAEQFVEPPRSVVGANAEPTETEELSRGDNAAITRQSPAPGGEVTTQQAARSLGISPRTVRWHIEQGNLEARPEGKGVNRTWLVSIASLQAFRDARQAAGGMPRGYRASAEHADITAEGPGEAVRVLAERLEDAAARAAEYRVRLELTEQAESTLRAELAEERRRREDAERERDELRRRLEASREALPEPRELPVSPGPSDTATDTTEERGGPQEAREATQSAAETLRVPDPRPTTAGPQPSPQRPPQTGSMRGRLWRRVFGR